MGTRFLVRTRADRLADGGPETVAEAIGRSPRRGLYRIAVRNRKGEQSEAVLEIRYRRIRLQTPKGKTKRYLDQVVTVIEAREQETPPDRDRIDWKLITDLAVNSRRQAVEKVQWHALRWKIEVIHKILKSGCRAEHARLRTAPRLVNLLAVFRILSWRVFWLTMTNRIAPDADQADKQTSTRSGHSSGWRPATAPRRHRWNPAAGQRPTPRAAGTNR